MQKPLNTSSLFETSALLNSLEKKADMLKKAQKDDKKALQRLLEDCVKIEAINVETKELYWSKIDGQPTIKLIRRIKSALVSHFGIPGCQWQCKLSGE